MLQCDVVCCLVFFLFFFGGQAIATRWAPTWSTFPNNTRATTCCAASTRAATSRPRPNSTWTPNTSTASPARSSSPKSASRPPGTSKTQPVAVDVVTHSGFVFIAMAIGNWRHPWPACRTSTIVTSSGKFEFERNVPPVVLTVVFPPRVRPFSVEFRDPKFDADFKFPAVRLPGAK